MLSLQEISDRLEIEDVFTRYSYAIDGRNWDELDNVFTPDAHIDYSEMGGAKGPFKQIKEWLKIALGDRFPEYQHVVASSQIKVDGDTATSRTGVKKDAEVEKKVADPPRTSSSLPKGVSTESRATLPTTRRLMRWAPIAEGSRCANRMRRRGSRGSARRWW